MIAPELFFIIASFSGRLPASRPFSVRLPELVEQLLNHPGCLRGSRAGVDRLRDDRDGAAGGISQVNRLRRSEREACRYLASGATQWLRMSSKRNMTKRPGIFFRPA